MRRLSIIVSLVAWTGPALAQGIVCDVVNELMPFSMIASTKLRSRVAQPLPATYCAFGMYYKGNICTTKALFNGVSVEPGWIEGQGEIVATKPAGTAVTFKTSSRKPPCFENEVDSVYTGGGLVKGTPHLGGGGAVIDTTGTHPLVSACSGAMLDMVGLSNAIAAMPAAQEFDTLTVDINDDFEIDATGGGVIRIGTLVLKSVPSRVSYGNNYGSCYYSGEDGAVLDVLADPGDQVILDVGALKIGACSEIYSGTQDFIINVGGRGRAVEVGVNALGSDANLNILAPQRTIKIEGDKVGEGTLVGFLWGKKVVTRGYVEMDTAFPCDL
jgi:hypothetical protein